MKNQDSWKNINVVQEAHRIADELRKSGTATGHCHAVDTVRWFMRDYVVRTDGSKGDDVVYTAAKR